MNKIRICSVSDVLPQSMRTFKVQEKSVLLANVNGEFLAIEDTCSHAQCSLGTLGHLDGQRVVCGCHGASFDLKSGKVLNLPATRDLATYAVSIDGDSIFVGIR